MKRNTIRNSLGSRLDVADLEYDVSRLNSELNFHRSKVVIFEQTVKAQQEELDALLGILDRPETKGEIYK